MRVRAFRGLFGCVLLCSPSRAFSFVPRADFCFYCSHPRVRILVPRADCCVFIILTLAYVLSFHEYALVLFTLTLACGSRLASRRFFNIYHPRVHALAHHARLTEGGRGRNGAPSFHRSARDSDKLIVNSAQLRSARQLITVHLALRCSPQLSLVVTHQRLLTRPGSRSIRDTD